MKSGIELISPERLIQDPAFSRVAITKGHGDTIYIGGQNAIKEDQEIVGKGDIAAQTEYVLENIENVLDACDATLDDLFKLTIYIVHGQDVRKGFQGAQKFLAKLKKPPVITGVAVAGLANPDYLVEIESVAFKTRKNRLA